MGTKRRLASRIAPVIHDCPPGPLLDLFSGVCAIGSSVAPHRQIWCNDIQVFSASVATAFFTSPSPPLNFDDVADSAYGPYKENKTILQARFATELSEERKALQSKKVPIIQNIEHIMPYVGTDEILERERIERNSNPSLTPYQLFTTTFSGAYFGLQQCIQIDSIRYAIDQLLQTSFLDIDQHNWMSVALCQAVSKIATTTGHFAQYIRVKENNCKRFLAQRSRSPWREWLRAIFQLSPIGTSEWRSSNRVYNSDAIELLLELSEKEDYPTVIYADPPYTRDQYSRYYHLYETLLKYDYPPSQATGRYRPDRFSSPYSKKTEVASAIEKLIAVCAQIGTHLVLSYPEVGLLPNSRDTIASLFRAHFGKTASITTLDHLHSSLGASKGREKYPVRELVFTAGKV